MVTKVPIIYIAGSGHSGSTLLDLLLGSHSQIESVGEVYKYLDPQRRMRILRCTCGATIDECAYWQSVQQAATSDGEDALSAADRSHRALVAVLRVSGKRLICDSSKTLEQLAVYAEHPDLFDLQILHLVRDGRGTAFSMNRKWLRMLAQHGSAEHAKSTIRARSKNPMVYGYYVSIVRWLRLNLRIAHRFAAHPGYHAIRYEDLADNPQLGLQAIMDRLNLPFEASQLDFARQQHHNVGGNSMRVRSDSTVKKDTEYQERLSPLRWGFGTLLGLPLLLKYGYRLRRTLPSP